ncbi:RHS repeat domain-containing protein [Pseudoxanthomonas winnipegensis]|nr:RHS repeat-associated core domain-containing protein [Pseudoxanthomonas winnipegensis]
MVRLFSCFFMAAMFLVAQAQAQTVEYIHTDALGTPVAVTDANRNVIERSEYSPYGVLLNRGDTDGPGYTGHVQDAATGLSYMQQRYYDPTLGRFLSVDPVTAYNDPVAAFNRYWYANNNPYRFTDPDGRAVQCDGQHCWGVSHSLIGHIMDRMIIQEIILSRATQDAINNIHMAEAESGGNGAGAGHSAPGSSQPVTPGAVDLVDDLAGQESKGRIEAGEGKILPGMGDKKFDPDTGTHDKVAISRDNADGTKTEVHADRNRLTGETENVKIKQQGENCRQARGCGEQ